LRDSLNYYDDVIGSSRIGMDILLLNRYGHDGIEEISDAVVITGLSEIIDLLPPGKNGTEA